MFVAFFSTITPIIGGLLTDFFATHKIAWSMELKSADSVNNLKLLNLHGWNRFFIIGVLLAMLALRLLTEVKGQGEVNKRKPMTQIRASLKRRLRKNMGHNVIDDILHPFYSSRTFKKVVMREILFVKRSDCTRSKVFPLTT